ncbi:MAG: PQQ-like beta-propeller repeat protein [Spirochaetales bacterium]|nr:PQQ-like beta-propeller repeat protein [Spirochaetales bacterium]
MKKFKLTGHAGLVLSLFAICAFLLIPAGCTTSVEAVDPAVSAPSADSGEGILDGVKLWTLPDAPDGSKPDQSWLAVGSDPEGNIYISGHDHVSNSMLYMLDARDGVLRWVGDAREASTRADNWESGETAEKFHTRPTYFDGRVYVATLDKSSLDNAFQSTRGFHWYAYDQVNQEFIDLSADEPSGVGAETLQIVTIQVDPVSRTIYGMSIPENKLVAYDIDGGTTTVLGKPASWTGYFYSNRFMWVDSRGRLYFTGGTERSQWNMGEPEDLLDHVWFYDPATGFGETDFSLQGAYAIEVGQWDKYHEHLYASDDLGHIYRFTDENASWEYLGRPGFYEGEDNHYNNNKVWVFNLSDETGKIYLGRSDNRDYSNEIWEYDIASGSSFMLCTIDELDEAASREAFITGYDTWDDKGFFYISVFSMYDFQNVLLMGINPEKIKAAKGL